MSKVIITGLTGQDGSYMSELCLKLDHQVFGMVRRTSGVNDKNYKHLKSNQNFHEVIGDLNDPASLNSLVKDVQPDYFINFASQSFVGDSWKIPADTLMCGSNGVLNCLEALQDRARKCRFYNAGSSEQFGDVIYTPQDELHPFRPRSVYGVGKCSAAYLVKVYRESYKMYAVQGLLFNHESERRGAHFVTRKITKGVAKIAKAIQDGQPFEPIYLGNLDAKRDWSHAEDFMRGVWMMLNQEQFRKDLKDVPVDQLYNKTHTYVLSSDETHTIREFVERSAEAAGIKGTWVGNGLDERFVFLTDFVKKNNPYCSSLVAIKQDFYRPNEVNLLMGDSKLARIELGWKPEISFDTLVKRMVSCDLHEIGARPFVAS